MAKVAITKNGYDVLRIIEGKKEDEKCEFKIIPRIPAIKVRIFYMKLFSKVEYFSFDNSKKIEITYHKSTPTQPAKIHLKLTNSKKEIEYKTLPLTKIINPNIHTEFPIPLFKIIIPEEALCEKFDSKKDYKICEINENNEIEIFMTKRDFINEDFYNNWPYMCMSLFDNCFEYFATGALPFLSKNANMTLYNSKKENSSQAFAVATDISEDIGILMITMKNNFITTKTLDFLFIENEVYLGFAAGTRIGQEKKGMIPFYQADLDNKKLSVEERKKWEYRFTKEIKKLDTLIKRNFTQYKNTENYYMDMMNQSINKKCNKE